LAEIRELLFAGKFKEATALTNETQIAKGKGSGQGNAAVNDVPYSCFQTLGDLYLNFGTNEQYSNYYRDLDLMTGVITTRFTINGVNYTREVFASHPDQAIVIRLISGKPNVISFNLSLSRPERFVTSIEGNRLVMFGTLSNGKGGNGMKYKTYVTPIVTGGTFKSVGNTLQINNATAVTILVTAKTNYRLHYPDYINPGWETELASITKTVRAQ
jgi:alpha-L-fucosidase 2